MSSPLNRRKAFWFRVAACCVVFPAVVAGSRFEGADSFKSGHHGSPRQYYGHWQKHSSGNFHYRGYFYKPTPSFSGFKHHVVIHHRSRPNHNYFYNPYKKQFWGRCEVNHGGKPEYSLLAPENRKGSISEIPESAFPAPGKLPPIPDSTDGESLDLPPDDLPEEDTPAN